MNFFTSVVKALTLKVKHFVGLIPTFVEVTGGKLVGILFRLPSTPRSFLQILEVISKFLESMKRLDENTTHIMGITKDTNVLVQSTDQKVMKLNGKFVLFTICFLVDLFTELSKKYPDSDDAT